MSKFTAHLLPFHAIMSTCWIMHSLLKDIATSLICMRVTKEVGI